MAADAKPRRWRTLAQPGVRCESRQESRHASVVGRGPLTPRRIRLFAESDPYACELIRREVGWKPTVTTEEGWRRAVEWFRASARGAAGHDGGVT